MRDDFTKNVKDRLYKRVSGLCSNPDCRSSTTGPTSDPSGVTTVGDAAHITAASPGGARYDPKLTSEERRSYNNGIWLCRNHAKMVDDDPEKYTVETLRRWKREAEKRAKNLIESNSNIDKTMLDLIDIKSPSEQLIIDPETGNTIVFDPVKRTVTKYLKDSSTVIDAYTLPRYPF